MKVAILSGKGGTGKTLVSVNLAALDKNSAYIDCDVEEPNGHLFFKPEDINKEDIIVKIPKVDENLCDGCRKCVEFCKFNALAYIKKLVVFEEICHSCGGCSIVCPLGAITERDKVIGRIEEGNSQGIKVKTGILNIGEPAGIPIINNLLKDIDNNKNTFIDCPPGSACTVMESIRDADYCILVAEPTIFGIHNLNMVYELVNIFDKKYGVVINKSIEGISLVDEFCNERNIKVLGKIPFDEELGRINSNGEIAVREEKKYHNMFRSIWEEVVKEANHEADFNS